MDYRTERLTEERWHLECRIKSGPPHMRAFLRVALAPLDEIRNADGLDHANQLIDDAILAHILATNPLAPEIEAALPERVQEFLRKARQGIN